MWGAPRAGFSGCRQLEWQWQPPPLLDITICPLFAHVPFHRQPSCTLISGVADTKVTVELRQRCSDCLRRLRLGWCVQMAEGANGQRAGQLMNSQRQRMAKRGGVQLKGKCANDEGQYYGTDACQYARAPQRQSGQ